MKLPKLLRQQALDIAKEKDHHIILFSRETPTIVSSKCLYCREKMVINIDTKVIDGPASEIYCVAEIDHSDNHQGQRSYRMIRVQLGFCYQCGNERGKDGTKHRCRKCQEINDNEVKKKVVMNGNCRNCRAPRGEDGTSFYCRECANVYNLKLASKNKELIASGKCIRCKRDRGEGGTVKYCRACANKNNAHERKRYDKQRHLNAQ